MAQFNKGLSFIDWNGLDHDEYNKLSKIISTSNKSSGVQLLYVDEEETHEVMEPDCDGLEEDKQTREVSGEPEVHEIPPKYEEKKVTVVDVKNSILHPAAPVFQPSVPPPSIMPFPIAVPHWPHGDPNMVPHQPQANHYSYHVPGGYMFHHDPNLVSHNGEATVAYVTLSNGQPAYAFPGHPIPAHHFQPTTIGSGIPAMPSAAAAAGHLAHQGDVILHPVPGSVIPTTRSHHPLVFPPHIAPTTLGQPMPAHMMPPHTVSQHHAPSQHSTQFMYMPPVPAVPVTTRNGPANYNFDTNPQPPQSAVVNSSLSSPSSESEIKSESSPISSVETKDDHEPSSNGSLGEIEFGGPVVFDTESSVTNSSSSNESVPSSSDLDKSPLSFVQEEKSQTPSDLPSKKVDKTEIIQTTTLSIPQEAAVVSPDNQTSNSNVSPKSSNVNKPPVSSNNCDSPDPIGQSSPPLNVNVNAFPNSSDVNTSSAYASSCETKGSNSQSSIPKLSNANHNDIDKMETQKGKTDNTEASLPRLPSTKKTENSINSSATGVITTTTEPTTTPATAPKSWSSLFGNSSQNSQSVSSDTTAASVKTSPSGYTREVKSLPYWQEQERQKQKTVTFPSSNKLKAVDVRQDPLAPKLLAKLSDFPITHIPIIIQPRGLKNGNNICFMNATLQVLMGCPPFIHLFRAFKYLPARTGNNSSTPVFDALVEFVNSFQNCQRRVKQSGPSKTKKGNEYDINVGAPFIPESLLNVAQNVLGLNIGVQHDAEEFLSQILSICNEEVEKIIQMKNMDSFNNNGGSAKKIGNGGTSGPQQNGHVAKEKTIGEPQQNGAEEDGDDSWVQVGPRNHCVETNVNDCGQTPLSAIFAGLSRSCLVRESGKFSDTVDSFFSLKLDIQAESVHSVRDALFRLNAMEDVHGVDGRKVNARRRMFFDVLPSVLIMHLKLFEYSNGNGQKIQKNIAFDVDLQIPKEMLSRVGKAKYPTLKARCYKLFGVVNHHGKKMNDGHYTSDVFLPIVNGWLHFDDSDVSLSDEASVLKYQDKVMPYLLFYRRIDV